MNQALIYGCRVWVSVCLVLYALAGFTGSRYGTAEHVQIDPTVRSSPGGYRSFHFWHTGFAGGK